MPRYRHFFAAALIAVSVPHLAAAQGAAASPRPGMTVTDASGAAVGSVTKVDQSMVTVNTGKHEIPVPLASFTPDGGKLLLGMSQDALNAAYEESLAQVEASLAVGSPVNGSEGSPVGTIEALDSETVTIKLSGGQKVQIPRSGIAGSPSGAIIGMSAQQLEAQVRGKAE